VKARGMVATVGVCGAEAPVMLMVRVGELGGAFVATWTSCRGAVRGGRMDGLVIAGGRETGGGMAVGHAP
jgi:hypothetical protein